MGKLKSADEEIVARIRSLDAEEDMWERRASRAETDRILAEAEAKRCANKRRQYEFALQTLGVEAPTPKIHVDVEDGPADPIAVKVGHGVIAEL